MTKLVPLLIVALFSLSVGICDGCKKPADASGGNGAVSSTQAGR